jgi:molecular chaperone HtpG
MNLNNTELDSQIETFSYSADTTNIMSILVKSIYTNKDIFLRELISNASDAINKACLIDNTYILNNQIKINFNLDNNQLIIQDTGCGITKHELINKIGSIGTSGTKQFIKEITNESKDKLIGQFGVGFYSVYLVSSQIKIITKSINENKIWEWKSNSESTYSIKELKYYDDINFNRGTKIILTLNNDSLEYLNEEKLIEIIKTHSSYIEHPIMFEKTYNNEKSEKKWEKINWIPLWAKPKNEINEQNYIDFYLHNIQDNLDELVKDPPIIYKHFKIEGSVNFTALLYIPTKAPFNLFESSKRGQSLKLYTKNVLISTDHKDLYPKWMEFVKGIIDTSDIELNVSRQTIQNNKNLRIISNQLIKKVIEMMEELVNKGEEIYNQFYREFSCSIKNGIHEEFTRNSKSKTETIPNFDYNNDRMIGNKYAKQMMKLLRFNTSFNRYIGFDEYIKQMKPEQKAIYYLAGDKKEALELSPFMDRLNELNLEVLFFEDPIDEYIKAFLTEYKIIEWNNNDKFINGDIVGVYDEGFERFKKPDMSNMNIKSFVDVSRDNLLLTNSILNNSNNSQNNIIDINLIENNDLCEKIKLLYDNIGIKFFEVKFDEKFTSVPAIIVNHVHLSAQLEKLLNNNASTKRNEQYKPVFDRKDMLLSSSNPIIHYLYNEICINSIPLNDPYIIEIAKTIYTSALIAGGYEPDNAFKFIKKFNDLLLNSLK